MNVFEIDRYLEGDEDDYCSDCGTPYDGLGWCPFCDYEPDDPDWLFYGAYDEHEGEE
jgi:hypothetical protein